MQRQSVRPRFQVEEIDDTVTVTKIIRKEEDGVFFNEEVKVEEPYGYHVYFPHGHSIRVRSHEELERLGFAQEPELIDEEGEVVGTTQPLSLKGASRRRAGKNRKPAAAASGATAASVGE